MRVKFGVDESTFGVRGQMPGTAKCPDTSSDHDTLESVLPNKNTSL